MNEQDFQKKLTELVAQIGELPEDQRAPLGGLDGRGEDASRTVGDLDRLARLEPEHLVHAMGIVGGELDALARRDGPAGRQEEAKGVRHACRVPGRRSRWWARASGAIWCASHHDARSAVCGPPPARASEDAWGTFTGADHPRRALQ